MEDIQKQQNMQEQEIDLIELAKKIWDGRKLILKVCGWAVLVGLVVGFSIPKEYTANVTLAPESTAGGKSMGGGLSALAGMAGINLGASQTADALSPELYPDIVKSIPFSIEMFEVKVTDMKGELNTTVYEYLKEHQKKPWWGYITSAPFKALGWVIKTIKGEKDEIKTVNTVDPFKLTNEQNDVISVLGKRISVQVDKKTSVIKISVTMQDPLIAATMTNEVMEKLQDYITEYRTNKARKDLEYTQKLYEESMQSYHEAQQEYAAYMDRNQNVSLRSAQTQQERLRNEMELAFNVYNQTAQQLQVAKAKVQEDTPVYTVVEAASVPLRATKPSKAMILIGFVFLAGVGACGWILFGKDLIDSFRK
jgi:uncharacterized protein involved in exopolysaccharide biosynthesis